MTDLELQHAILTILHETPTRRVTVRSICERFEGECRPTVERCIGQLMAWERVTWTDRGVRLAASVRSA